MCVWCKSVCVREGREIILICVDFRFIVLFRYILCVYTVAFCSRDNNDENAGVREKFNFRIVIVEKYLIDNTSRLFVINVRKVLVNYFINIRVSSKSYFLRNWRNF